MQGTRNELDDTVLDSRLVHEARVGCGIPMPMHGPLCGDLERDARAERRIRERRELTARDACAQVSLEQRDDAAAAPRGPESRELGEVRAATIEQLDADAVRREQAEELARDRLELGARVARSAPPERRLER